MRLLNDSGRGEEASIDAARFLLAQLEDTAQANTAARCVWKYRARDPALASRVATFHTKLDPVLGHAWVRRAWFELAGGDVDGARKSLETGAEWFAKAAKNGKRSVKDQAKDAANAKRAKKTASALGGPRGTGLLDAFAADLAKR